MNHLSNLKGKLLVEQVEDELFQMIKSEAYGVGEKLPNEFKLAETFSVSRSTMREAIRSLTSKGILEVRRGSGTYVVGTMLPEDDPLGIKDFEDKEAIALDLVDVRLMIEPAMAEAACRNATDEEIAHLEELCDLVEEKARNGESYIKEDIAFHCYVAECSKNKVVEQLVPIIDTAVMMFVNITHKKVLHETLLTHRAVVDAIAARDPVGARNAMIMHMTFNRSMIQKIMKERS
ncbi:MAG: FadR/GntR family transcriptional regulator [bacterium]|nr:FadR/GntR family transcriptional regulator [bacterium]